MSDRDCKIRWSKREGEMLTMRTSFDDADGESLRLRDQLLSDMGVKFFLDPGVIVIADDDGLATILMGCPDQLGDQISTVIQLQNVGRNSLDGNVCSRDLRSGSFEHRHHLRFRSVLPTLLLQSLALFDLSLQ